MQSSNVKEVTYLNVPHKVQTHSFHSKATGKRIFVRKNMQSNDIEIRAVNGDGRTSDFEEYEKTILENSVLGIESNDVMKIVNEFAEKYFND